MKLSEAFDSLRINSLKNLLPHDNIHEIKLIKVERDENYNSKTPIINSMASHIQNNIK
jgi:hypothetical protein